VVNASFQPSCPRLLKITLKPPSNGTAVLYPTYKKFTGTELASASPRQVAVPSQAEDAAAAETSYMRAMLRSRSATTKFPGLQSFCSGGWLLSMYITSSDFRLACVMFVVCTSTA
jgi:hypothetical protein